MMKTGVWTAGLIYSIILGLLATLPSTAQSQDSSADTTIPSMTEFVPVEIIAEMIHYKMPSYPPLAKAHKLVGLVWIKCLAGRDGEVKDVAVHRSCGHRLLDLGALAEAPECKFRPAYQYGRPVAMWVTYKVDFVLPGRKSRHIKGQPFQVDTEVSSDIYSLWDDLSKESLTGGQNEDIVSEPRADGSDNTDATANQDFGILLMRETDRTERALQRSLVLIDGGCSNGLKVGMIGAVWDHSGDAPVRLATVEVQDVQAFESMCLVESLEGRRVSVHHRITLDLAPLSDQELLARALDYFNAGLTDKAQACFERLSSLADSNPLIATHLEECRKLSKPSASELTDSELQSLRDRVPNHLVVARAHLRLGNPLGARRYLDKVLVVDSTDEHFLELHEAVDVFDSCQINLLTAPAAKDNPPIIDTIPRLVRAGHPSVRVPPMQYYYRPRGPDGPIEEAWVRALVSSTGRVVTAAVEQSSGLVALDFAAVEGAFDSQFEPGISCGRPTSMWVKWKVQFARNIGYTKTDFARLTETEYPAMDEFVAVDSPAEMTHYQTPHYPREAEQAGQQGLLWIKGLVGNDGTVKDAVVYKTSGTPSLDQAALEAAWGCKFKPAIQYGKPVAMWVTWKVDFVLRR